MTSVLRTDILTADLKESARKFQVIAETHFNAIVNRANTIDKTRTPSPAKEIDEVMELFIRAIQDYDQRTHANTDAQVRVTYEDPDVAAEFETVTVKLTRRQPGMAGRGAPYENETKQLAYILREVKDDTENPGYKRAILGRMYDNTVRLTCWARTNKQATKRSLWLETVMEEYLWWFGYSGVNRVLFLGRGEEATREISGNKLYGRSLDFFVRTEKLQEVSQRELEQIVVRMAIA